MSSSSDETIILAAVCLVLNRKKKLKKRRYNWTKDWLNKRSENLDRGALSLIHNELRIEEEAYRINLRMDEDCFNLLLSKIKHNITYRDTRFRQCINARDRLRITLRFLATGESFQSLSYHFQVGRSTISGIIPEVLNAICKNLLNKYIKVPTTHNGWTAIEQVFRERWNFPNCCGAIGGKHIDFQAPRSKGPFYSNYREYDSIVLMAMAGGDYKFLSLDVGSNAKTDDGGVFRNSLMSDYIHDNSFNIPENVQLPESNDSTPFVFVGDDAFPLTNRLLKPFRYHGLDTNKKNYNYRVNRARRVVENSFAILANRFQVLSHPIHLCESKVEQIITACCILHNYLITQRGQQYIGDIINMTENDAQAQKLQPLHRSLYAGNRSTQTAVNLRSIFLNYFNTVGQVNWQEDHVSTKQ